MAACSQLFALQPLLVGPVVRARRPQQALRRSTAAPPAPRLRIGRPGAGAAAQLAPASPAARGCCRSPRSANQRSASNGDAASSLAQPLALRVFEPAVQVFVALQIALEEGFGVLVACRPRLQAPRAASRRCRPRACARCCAAGLAPSVGTSGAACAAPPGRAARRRARAPPRRATPLHICCTATGCASLRAGPWPAARRSPGSWVRRCQSNQRSMASRRRGAWLVVDVHVAVDPAVGEPRGPGRSPAAAPGAASAQRGHAHEGPRDNRTADPS